MSLVLSPVTVIGCITFEPFKPLLAPLSAEVGVFLCFMAMVLAFAIPLFTLIIARSRNRPDWGWACAGLAITLIGWGGLLAWLYSVDMLRL